MMYGTTSEMITMSIESGENGQPQSTGVNRIPQTATEREKFYGDLEAMLALKPVEPTSPSATVEQTEVQTQATETVSLATKISSKLKKSFRNVRVEP